MYDVLKVFTITFSEVSAALIVGMSAVAFLYDLLDTLFLAFDFVNNN